MVVLGHVEAVHLVGCDISLPVMGTIFEAFNAVLADVNADSMFEAQVIGYLDVPPKTT